LTYRKLGQDLGEGITGDAIGYLELGVVLDTEHGSSVDALAVVVALVDAGR